MKATVMLACLAVMALFASCDPVREDQANALGGEAPGVSPGPTHRPGQPCLICHEGGIGHPPAFAIGGTIFQLANAKTPEVGAVVTLTGADGSTRAVTSNEVGNFYLTADEYSPVYPLHVSVASGGTTVTMQSHIGGNGACAGCHFDPAGPDSPGHVYFTVVGATP